MRVKIISELIKGLINTNDAYMIKQRKIWVLIYYVSDRKSEEMGQKDT